LNVELKKKSVKTGDMEMEEMREIKEIKNYISYPHIPSLSPYPPFLFSLIFLKLCSFAIQYSYAPSGG
jgi:hypothetical protein